MTPAGDDSHVHRLDLAGLVLLTAPDQRMFVACLERVAGRGDRWVYTTTDGARHDGGIYAREETIEAIQARFTDWWRDGLWRIGGG